MVDKSDCKCSESLVDCITLYKKMSSANKRKVEEQLLPISFIYKRDIKGPEILPCGTPEDTQTGQDEAPSTETDCSRCISHFFRKRLR